MTVTPVMNRLLSNWRAADISRRPEPREEHASEENLAWRHRIRNDFSIRRSSDFHDSRTPY